MVCSIGPVVLLPALDQAEPLAGRLDLSLPAVDARDRPHDLNAGGEPRLDERQGDPLGILLFSVVVVTWMNPSIASPHRAIVFRRLFKMSRCKAPEILRREAYFLVR